VLFAPAISSLRFPVTCVMALTLRRVQWRAALSRSSLILLGSRSVLILVFPFS
jgi:hypothetical protein